MADKYGRIIARALSQPWCLTPEYLLIVQDLLRFRASGGRLSAEEVRARIGEDDAPPPTSKVQGSIAVIPIYGVIAHRNFEASSGMTSTEFIGKMLRRAVTDDAVKAIVLDTSSPGGTVEGVPELADEILAARKVKYISAVSNSMMASAAYWLGSQASEIVVTPSGNVGSIGCYSLHQDLTGALEKDGVKITSFSYGDRKLEGAPWLPLDADAKANFQARVDEVGTEFVAAVARGRGVKVSDVKANYGKGRVFSSDEAKAHGMVDRIATLEETILRLAGGSRRSTSGMKALTPAAARALEDTPPVVAELPDASAPVAAADADTCPTCNGAGLMPEAYMGDPAGQETCTECGGNGKRAATDQAAADRDALATALALAEA